MSSTKQRIEQRVIQTYDHLHTHAEISWEEAENHKLY